MKQSSFILTSISALPAAQQFMEDWYVLKSIGVKERTALSIITDEVLANIFNNNPNQDSLRIEVTLKSAQGHAGLIFSDNGIPFDPLMRDTAGPWPALEERLPGGLGIHLIRSLADEVSYQYHEGKNILHIKKLLP